MWVVSLYKAIKQLITTPKLLIPNIHLYLLKMPFTIFDISGVGSVVVDLEAVYFFAKLCMTFFSPPTTKFFLHKLKLDTFFWVVSFVLFFFLFDLCEWYKNCMGAWSNEFSQDDIGSLILMLAWLFTHNFLNGLMEFIILVSGYKYNSWCIIDS